MAVLLIVSASLAGALGRLAHKAVPPLIAGDARKAPTLGVDLIYYATPPFILIRSFTDKSAGDDAGKALRDLAGVRTVRFSSHGLWSPLGEEATVRLRREVRLPNYFPWFPPSALVDWVVTQDMRIVLGVNPEEPPAASVALIREFANRNALGRIVAIELGNEPHLNHRPWQPEEYGIAASALVEALQEFGLPFAVPLTLGSEANTPVGISDDEYTRRQLQTMSELIDLRERDDIYGVIHLYARGVDPNTIDELNKLVRPFAPRMRYLVTEYNIRSSLAQNQHLTRVRAQAGETGEPPRHCGAVHSRGPLSLARLLGRKALHHRVETPRRQASRKRARTGLACDSVRRDAPPSLDGAVARRASGVSRRGSGAKLDNEASERRAQGRPVQWRTRTDRPLVHPRRRDDSALGA
jgi:hypothetical protein